jgi:hypothetical protein
MCEVIHSSIAQLLCKTPLHCAWASFARLMIVGPGFSENRKNVMAITDFGCEPI